MKAITITPTQLRAALLEWEHAARAGQTRTREETQALDVEQVAQESCTDLWQRLQAGTPNSGERWAGMGGIFICTLPAIGDLSARHLVAHEAEHDGLTWGAYGEEVAGASSRSDGASNTAALIGRGAGKHPAAEWAAAQQADGYTDFHLPSQMDLFMASLYAPQLFSKDSWYWTSTQDSRDTAFVQDFAYGHSYWVHKGDEFRVRAVRTIQL